MTNSCLDKALNDDLNGYRLTVNWRVYEIKNIRPMSVHLLLDLLSPRELVLSKKTWVMSAVSAQVF